MKNFTAAKWSSIDNYFFFSQDEFFQNYFIFVFFYIFVFSLLILLYRCVFNDKSILSLRLWNAYFPYPFNNIYTRHTDPISFWNNKNRKKKKTLTFSFSFASKNQQISAANYLMNNLTIIIKSKNFFSKTKACLFENQVLLAI